MIRTALIGVSGFGEVHYADLLREVKAARMRAVAATVINPDEEQAKCEVLRGLGCRLFADYREMLGAMGGQLDLCLIPTGIALHAPMTVAALRAGANVLVEKPAAATVAEVRAMQAAERASGKFVAVGYQAMYGPEVQRIKQAIGAGRIGRLVSVRCRGLWPRYDRYYARNRWAARLKTDDGAWVLDSPFNNALAHYLNLMAFLSGSEPAASCRPAAICAELYRARPIESCDTACLRIATEGGPRLHFTVSHCCREQVDPAISLIGTRGRIVWSPTGRARVEPAGGPAEEFPADPGGLRPRMFDAVIRRVNDPSVFTCTLDIAGVQTLCANGAHASSPIHTVPADRVEREPVDDDWLTAIRGIEDLSARSVESEALFSELGVPWAVAGRDVTAAEAAAWAGA